MNAAPVFGINAITYLFAVIGLLWATYPRHTNARVAEQGFARLLSGIHIARQDPLIMQPADALLVLVLLARIRRSPSGDRATEFRIGPKSWQYGVLYACFALGATLGALSVGTVFARVSKSRLLRPRSSHSRRCSPRSRSFASRPLSYPVALLLGYAYFVAITALSTLIQSHLVDEERGRVMALWIMGFGGTVPVGVLVAGWIGDMSFDHRRDPGGRGLGVGARRVVECAVSAGERCPRCLSLTPPPIASSGRDFAN